MEALTFIGGPLHRLTRLEPCLVRDFVFIRCAYGGGRGRAVRHVYTALAPNSKGEMVYLYAGLERCE